MKQELKKTVDYWRMKGFIVTEQEANMVESLCERKMEVNKIEGRENYLPVLFEDEMLNYLFRKQVNEISHEAMAKMEKCNV